MSSEERKSEEMQSSGAEEPSTVDHNEENVAFEAKNANATSSSDGKMNESEMNNEKSSQNADAEEPSIAERAAETAFSQAGEAASALRQGKFMEDATVDAEANSDDRLIALLSYGTQIIIPLIMPIIVLLSESSKKRPFQRYHAVQSLALMLVFIGVTVLGFIAVTVLQIVPVVNFVVTIAAFCFTPILYMMALIAMIYYGYQAYKGRRFAIPGLTSFLRDQGWL